MPKKLRPCLAVDPTFVLPAASLRSAAAVAATCGHTLADQPSSVRRTDAPNQASPPSSLNSS